jgi:hypothetical protein
VGARRARGAKRRSSQRRPTLRASFARADRFVDALTVIAVTGLVARVVATLVANQHTDLGLGDGFFYHHSARLLAEGEGYLDPIRVPIGDARATALHPPLWSTLLAVPSAVGLDSELAHRLVGCVIGAANIVVVGWCGRLFAGRRVGLVAAAMAALHPTLLAADGSLHAETVFGLFASLTLLCAMVAVRDQNVGAAAAAGAMAALAALARGEGLVLAVIMGVAFLVLCRGRNGWRMALAIGGVTLVLIAPWTLRNQIMMGEPVLLSTNDSTVLAGANCDPTYSGYDVGTWHVECVRSVPFSVSEVDRSAIWREDAIDYGLDHLDQTPKVAVARLLRIWGLWRPGQQEIVEGRSPGIQQVGISLHVFVVLPLAIAGVWTSRKRTPMLWLVLVPIITVAVTGVLAFGTLRFRHGAETALALLAASAVVWAVDRIRGHRTADRYDASVPAG